MSESTEVQAVVRRLEDLEAIKRLKHRYMRCVDTKQWDELAGCFCPDATTDYGGRHKLTGVEAIIGFLKTMESPDIITMHQVHHPEIELTGPGKASATWTLEDYVINLSRGWSLHGTALYHDRYARVNGEWKIEHTGYKRIFSETWTRSDIKSLKLTESMFGPVK